MDSDIAGGCVSESRELAEKCQQSAYISISTLPRTIWAKPPKCSRTLIVGTMEALKAEVAAKRKALQDDTGRPTKYMRRGDIERLQEEQQVKEAKEREDATRREAEAEAEAQAVAAKASIVSLDYSIEDIHVLIRKWRAGPFTVVYELATSNNISA